MPEITVNIYNHPYRLAVSQGEEELIQHCAGIVDQKMRFIRNGGKVINHDQIAVLVALEMAYEVNQLEKKALALSEREPEPQPEPKTEEAADLEPLMTLLTEKDDEIKALKARIASLEARPEPTPVTDEQLLKDIAEISKQCEAAIFSDMRKSGVF